MFQIYLVLKETLASRVRFPIFIAMVIMFFGLLITIPLITIPGNDLIFQLKIFKTRDYLLMISLAVLVGLYVILQIYSFQQSRMQRIAQSAVQGATYGVMGIFGGILGTAACASCLAYLFGLIGLGAGSVLFVLKNQSYFLIGAIALMIISLYFAARKVNRVCDSC